MASKKTKQKPTPVVNVVIQDFDFYIDGSLTQSNKYIGLVYHLQKATVEFLKTNNLTSESLAKLIAERVLSYNLPTNSGWTLGPRLSEFVAGLDEKVLIDENLEHQVLKLLSKKYKSIGVHYNYETSTIEIENY
jgi:hypothetical protein